MPMMFQISRLRLISWINKRAFRFFSDFICKLLRFFSKEIPLELDYKYNVATISLNKIIKNSLRIFDCLTFIWKYFSCSFSFLFAGSLCLLYFCWFYLAYSFSCWPISFRISAKLKDENCFLGRFPKVYQYMKR